MPSSKTPNYSLSQWERADKVLMEDFNADNAKIDAALKAQADADAALSDRVSKLGNCQIHYMSYTGSGASARTFTFPRKPLLIIAMGGNLIVRAVQGAPYAMCRTNGEPGELWQAEWSGNSVTLSGGTTGYGPNTLNTAYHLVALMDAGG